MPTQGHEDLNKIRNVRRGMREKSMLATYRSAVGDWINSRAEHHVFSEDGNVGLSLH